MVFLLVFSPRWDQQKEKREDDAWNGWIITQTNSIRPLKRDELSYSYSAPPSESQLGKETVSLPGN